jgi:tRNA-2-methylthio-N6-dimethylallyladenosine synthase
MRCFRRKAEKQMDIEVSNYYIETYGCQMNFAESAVLKLTLSERGWVEARKAETALLVIINTCSVRETAERRVFGRLAHYASLKKKRHLQQESMFILVCGCMASRLKSKLTENGADFIMNTRERPIFTQILTKIETRLVGACRTPSEKSIKTDEEPPFSFAVNHHVEGSFRSFVPIMHGCNNFCSYCIVPYTRGREISRDPDEISAEITFLAAHGAREITLLGQNVNSYTKNGLDFPSLLERIARDTEGTSIKRARFLSSHPKDLSFRTIQVMAEHPVFCRHLHLCVQHGSNRILAAMNRRYTREHFLELCAEIRAAMPEITLSTDILVGFPGETDGDFEEILTLMEEVRFLYSYMYHYNPREGTEAFDLPDRIEPEIKAARLERVIALQMRHTAELLRSRIGGCEEVLIEGISRKNSDELVCRTERDEMVVAEGGAQLIGKFAKIRLDGLSGNTLRGCFIRSGV